MKPNPDSETRSCSLNWKPSPALTGEAINHNLKDHAIEVADWHYRELAQILHTWAEIFNKEFHLDLHVPAIQVETIARNRYGTYRQGRNGFGVEHEITVNAQHIDRPLAAVLCTLFHERLHEWQLLYGKPGRGNYHNKEFRQKASPYGLIIDSRGHTLVSPGRFTSLRAKYEVDSKALPSPEENVIPRRLHGNSKMGKYRCGCTTVRCAVDLLAHCDQCGRRFLEAPPSW